MGRVEQTRRRAIVSVVYLPKELVSDLPKNMIHVRGIINGVPFSVVTHSKKNGARFIVIDKKLRAEAKVKAGDNVNINVTVFNPHEVEIPETRDTVAQSEDDPWFIQHAFVPDLKSSLQHCVNDLKAMDLGLKRKLESIQKSRTIGSDTFPGGKLPD